jgi:para-nitrobenzyl esterase
MARRHDVVVVTVNHRLNALGFLDLSEIGGPAYAQSANVGMTDLVSALKWVRDNIANFGGDPNRVMIYGQSGGASKVTTLMGMPSAEGLFHRAGVQSGGGGNFITSEQSRAVARQLMIELGLAPNDIAALRRTDWAKLIEAGRTANIKLNPPLGPTTSVLPLRLGWAPVVDGAVLPSRPFFDGAPEMSKHVPMLIGCTSEEGFPNSFPFNHNPSEAEWRASLAKLYGADKANALADAMKAAHPEKSIAKLAFGVQGLDQRNRIQKIVKQRLDQPGGAAIYQYWFTWQTKQLEGRSGAYHTAELAFCFDNTARCGQQTGDTAEAQTLAALMGSAWAAFAHGGNPSTPQLHWPPTDAAHAQTMIFDTRCRVENDPDAAARHILLA